MKKLAAMIMTIAVCAAMFASCGANSKDTAEVKTTTTTAAQTTAEPTTTAATTTAPTTAAQTTAATTAKATAAKTTVKATVKANAAKPAHKTKAAKKNERPAQPKTTKKAAKATQKATQKAAAKKGLTKADYEWALQKGIDYIKSLPKAFIQPNASGYRFENVYCGTDVSRERLFEDLREAIDIEYEPAKDGTWDRAGMSLKLQKNPVDGYEFILRCDAW